MFLILPSPAVESRLSLYFSKHEFITTAATAIVLRGNGLGSSIVVESGGGEGENSDHETTWEFSDQSDLR